MRASSRPTRPRRSALAGLAIVGSAALLAGCGGTATSQQNANTAEGKELFQQKCGSCHVLEDAGTQGQVGPNLDDAFEFSRAQGFHESTFFEVTLEQMKIPGPPMPEFDDPDDDANYLEEDQLVSVASYVASVAGRPGPGAGAAAGSDDPMEIFVASCGSCHVLEDAGTTGQVGPNLDEAQPGLEAAVTQITNGGGGMPPFEGVLTEEQIQALAEYLVEATGGGSRR